MKILIYFSIEIVNKDGLDNRKQELYNKNIETVKFENLSATGNIDYLFIT